MISTTNFTRFFAVILVLAFSSCSEFGSDLAKKNKDLPNMASNANSKKSGGTLSGVFILAPSGDISGVSDANAIEAALNALPSGGTILLERGTYYTNREILVPDFSGTLTGSGKDETEIVGVGDGVTPFSNGNLFFFDTPSGGLTVSNLSLSLPDDFVTTFGNLFSFILVPLSAEGSDTHFDKLRMTGTDAVPGLDPIFVSQPNNSIIVTGDFGAFPSFSSGGLHTVSNSEFSEVAFQATQYQGFNNATIEVFNNSFSDVKQTIYRYMSGSSVSITNNVMDTYSFGAIVVTQEGSAVLGDPNSVVIRGNTISTAGFMPIEIGWVPEGSAYFKLLIEKNKLTNDGPDPVGIFSNVTGIGIFNGNDGAIVRNNNVRGEADFGILQESNGGTFIGNNLEGINALAAGYGLFSNGNTVVGGGNATVIDGGVDNIITGLKKVEGVSVGDRIKEAQARRKEILDALNN